MSAYALALVEVVVCVYISKIEVVLLEVTG
jgi:hypothetical protein